MNYILLYIKYSILTGMHVTKTTWDNKVMNMKT